MMRYQTGKVNRSKEEEIAFLKEDIKRREAELWKFFGARLKFAEKYLGYAKEELAELLQEGDKA